MKIKEFLILIFLALSLPLKGDTIVVVKKLCIDNQFYKENVTYYINEVLDLREDTLFVPNNCILKFSKEGKLVNGVIIGENTIIEASKKLIFEDIVINGIWKNKYVYSQWVNLIEDGESNNNQFEALMALCRGTNITHLYTQKGEYYLDPIKGTAPILIPSNTYWHNASVLKLKECNYSKYSLVYLDKVTNITIDGGEFIGDLVKHQGTKGEWGHGIKCGGARNVVLKNLTCKYFWGDGIDLIEGLDSKGEATIICDNILINNVKCLYNRRQGLSIEAAKHVKVLNSEFCYTGMLKKTKPSAGIDIEPWDNNGKKLSDIVIRNCIISNNKGPDLMICTSNHIGINNSAMELINVSVENCQIGYSSLYKVAGICFSQCNIKDFVKVYYSDYVDIDKTTIIKRLILKENGLNIKIKR